MPALFADRKQATYLSWSGALIIPGSVYLILFYAIPIAQTLRLSLGSASELASFIDIALSKSTWIVFRQTLSMAVIVTIITLLLAYPVACFLIHVSTRLRRCLLLLVLLPYWISTLVRSYAWISILSQKGIINWLLITTHIVDRPLDLLYNRFGAVVGMVNVVLPLMIFVLFSAFSRIDRNLLKIGAVLGGRPLFVFGRIWLPLSMSGVASGCILVFLFSLGVFTTPAILGGSGETSVAMAIEQQVDTLLNIPAAAALSTLLLCVSFVLLAAMRRFWVPALLGTPGTSQPGSGRRVFAIIFDRVAIWAALLRPARPAGTVATQGRRFWPMLFGLINALIFLYLMAPVFVVIGLSFSSASFLQFPPHSFSLRWFRAFFTTEAWTDSALRSLAVALMATAVVAVLGLATAHGIDRKRGRLREWLFVVFLSPLVMPPTILAFGLYYLYAKLGWIGSLSGLAAAHVVLVLPFMVVALSQGIRALDPMMEVAAGSLGARPIYAFRRVTLPLLRMSIVSGALLAFLTSFDELIVALFLTGPTSTTLPKQMWNSVLFQVDPTNAAAATLLIAFSIVMLGASIAADAGRRYGLQKIAQRNHGD